MHRFRTDLVNWTLSLLLGLGMAAHLVAPASGKAQKAAFTQWLDRNLVESGEDEKSTIRTHLKQLPSKYEEFPVLLRQASLLVLNHRNDFRLSTADREQSEADDGLWLLKSWSQHRDLGGSMQTLLAERFGTVLKWVVQQHHPLPAGHALSTLKSPAGEGELLSLPFRRAVSLPFLSSIRINAP